jgi:TRAP-type C4-dicarboxylate transport system permease large subunit
MIGLLTPPYGLLLFVTANITGEPIHRIVREALPFIAVLIAALLFMTYVPETVLWLPRLMGYKG